MAQTRKELVLLELIKAKNGQNYYSNGTLIKDGWVPNHVLQQVDIGGTAWRTRISDLRLHDHLDVECQQLFVDNRRTGTYLYRLKQTEPVKYSVKQEQMIIA